MNIKTIRHLSSGFLGGFLGMLTLSYVHPWLYWVGAFVGAVIGYWPDEITRSIASCRIGGLRPHFGRLLPHPMSWAKWAFYPMILLLGLANVVHVYYFYRLADWAIRTDYPELALLLLVMWIIGTAGGMALAVVSLTSGKERMLMADMSDFYREHEKWSNGRLRYTAILLADLVRAQVVCMAILLALFTSVVCFILYMGLVLIPMTIICGTAQGFSIAARRGKYWVGFFASLVTVPFIAWWFSPDVTDPRVLWTAALFAAAISGALAEAMRCGFLSLLAANARVRHFVRVPIKRRAAVMEKRLDQLMKFFEAASDLLRLRQISPTYMG